MDLMVTILSYSLTYILRDQLVFLGLETLNTFSYYFPYLGVVLITWTLLLRAFNNYDFLQGGPQARRRIFINLLPVEILGLAILAMALFFLRDRTISRTFLAMFAVINYILLVLFKLASLAYFRREDKIKKYHRRALLVGNRKAVDHFLEVQRNMPELLFDIIVRPEFITTIADPPDETRQEQLTEGILDYVWNNVVDEVIISYSDLDLNAMAPLITECGRMGLSVNVVLDTSGIEFRRTEVDVVGHYNIISFQSFDYSPPQRLAKRLIDIVSGFIGTLLFSVLFIFIAPLIKLTSPGPILFRQTRKGKNGREFKLFKFRTMYADAEARKQELLGKNEMQGQIFKVKNDPRVTPVGRFLRKTSLDEWPQFVNIMRGDMSLVGTRPPTVGEFSEYETHHRRRLSVQPGLTGLWQVSGRNEISDFEKIVQLDTWYIDHWSIWLDLKIIFKTFLVLCTGR
jgi:exopolysaccharide biosynthesis polyprenyl glycosylphosphotransferase